MLQFFIADFIHFWGFPASIFLNCRDMLYEGWWFTYILDPLRCWTSEMAGRAKNRERSILWIVHDKYTSRQGDQYIVLGHTHISDDRSNRNCRWRKLMVGELELYIDMKCQQCCSAALEQQCCYSPSCIQVFDMYFAWSSHQPISKRPAVED